MNRDNILVVELGEFKSVLCCYEPPTRAARFGTAKTGPTNSAVNSPDIPARPGEARTATCGVRMRVDWARRCERVSVQPAPGSSFLFTY